MSKNKESSASEIINQIASYMESAAEMNEQYITVNTSPDTIEKIRENLIRDTNSVANAEKFQRSLQENILKMSSAAQKMEKCIINKDIDGIINALKEYCRYQSTACRASAQISLIAHEASGQVFEQGYGRHISAQNYVAEHGSDLEEKIDNLKYDPNFREIFAMWVSQNIAPAINKIFKGLNLNYRMDESCGLGLLNKTLDKADIKTQLTFSKDANALDLATKNKSKEPAKDDSSHNPYIDPDIKATAPSKGTVKAWKEESKQKKKRKL